MTCHPVCQSVREPSASLAGSLRGGGGGLCGTRRCEGLTEHAMASTAAASSRGEAQNTADWLSGTWKQALQKRRDVVNMLKGTKLQPMADELGFWAYPLKNAFSADMHNKLVILMNGSFYPTKGMCETTRRHNKYITK